MSTASGGAGGGDSSSAWRAWIAGLNKDDIVIVTDLVEAGLDKATTAIQEVKGWTLDGESIAYLHDSYSLEVLQEYVGPVTRTTSFRGNDLPSTPLPSPQPTPLPLAKFTISRNSRYRGFSVPPLAGVSLPLRLLDRRAAGHWRHGRGRGLRGVTTSWLCSQWAARPDTPMAWRCVR